MIEMEKGADLMQALVDSELQPLRGQARKTIASNAVTINGEKQSDPEYFFQDSDVLFDRYTLLRRGKKITAWCAGNNYLILKRSGKPLLFMAKRERLNPLCRHCCGNRRTRSHALHVCGDITGCGKFRYTPTAQRRTVNR